MKARAVVWILMVALTACSGGGGGGSSGGGGDDPKTPNWSTISTAFDGTDERASTATLSTLLGGSPVSVFTIAFWINFQSPPNNFAGILGTVSNNGWTDGMGFYWSDPLNGLAFFINKWDGATQRVVATGLVPGRWYHVAAVWNQLASPSIRLYVDGKVVSTNTYSTAPVNVPAAAVMLGALGNEYADVLLDEVALWNVALGGHEIAAIYNEGTPVTLLLDSGDYVSSGSLVAYWLMGEEAAFPTIPDVVGGNDAMMVNMEAADLVEDAP